MFLTRCYSVQTQHKRRNKTIGCETLERFFLLLFDIVKCHEKITLFCSCVFASTVSQPLLLFWNPTLLLCQVTHQLSLADCVHLLAVTLCTYACVPVCVLSVAERTSHALGQVLYFLWQFVWSHCSSLDLLFWLFSSLRVVCGSLHLSVFFSCYCCLVWFSGY